MTTKLPETEEDYCLPWDMVYELKEDQAYIVHWDWLKSGLTGKYHPCGEGRRFVQGCIWSNEWYRQLVERPDGYWDDCILVRKAEGPVLLTSRIVNPSKAYAVARFYGVDIDAIE